MTLNTGRGRNLKYRPLAFTEHGAIMAATILNSSRAERMSVYVVRAFVKMRESLLVNAETRKQFDQVFEAILGLSGPARGRQ